MSAGGRAVEQSAQQRADQERHRRGAAGEVRPGLRREQQVRKVARKQPEDARTEDHPDRDLTDHDRLAQPGAQRRQEQSDQQDDRDVGRRGHRLTETGAGLTHLVKALADWSSAHRAVIAQARHAYDLEHPESELRRPGRASTSHPPGPLGRTWIRRGSAGARRPPPEPGAGRRRTSRSCSGTARRSRRC
ncbi:hypothetical protein AMK19_27790 [Kitasatospora sp. CB01950]|nr:hypothetical protein AMK19_27790 [Kitasatospora sp. CB01950]